MYATLLAVVVLLASVATPATSQDGASVYLDAVRQYADNVLQHGRDSYGDPPTPLFVDGINVDTHEPATWVYGGERWIMSNLASHQNLFRILVGLTALTGEPEYRQAAHDALVWGFENLQHENGLMHWAGHRTFDLSSQQAVGEGFAHEMKSHFPFYEFMWEVNPEATRRFVNAFWNAHVLDFKSLDMNRHGSYGRAYAEPWDQEYGDVPVFFLGKGLSFVNCGGDLIHAAGWLSRLSGDERPLIWSRRFAQRYVDTRDPVTGLGGYQFSQLSKDGESIDRALRQFGPEFGDRALEGKILDRSRGMVRYAIYGLMLLSMGEMLGEEGNDFVQWAAEDLAAYARWVYNPEDNTVQGMLTDGTILTPEDVRRSGYYDAGGFERGPISARFLHAYARAWRLTGDEELWTTARHIASGYGLGDIGETPGQTTSLDLTTDLPSVDFLYAMMELYRGTGASEYLQAARRIADNIIAQNFNNGFFTRSPDHPWASFDSIEPLALLHLAAMLDESDTDVPVYPGPSRGYFQCTYDGHGRTYDFTVIYGQRRQPD